MKLQSRPKPYKRIGNRIERVVPVSPDRDVPGDYELKLLEKRRENLEYNIQPVVFYCPRTGAAYG